MLVPRFKPDSFTNVPNGGLFRFLDDRKVYQMVDNNLGTYIRRSGKRGEILTLQAADHREIFRTRVIELIEMPELTPDCQKAFDAMCLFQKTTGTPSAYLDDLFIHDRRILANHQPKVFGWSVRDTGTHMMIPDDCYSLFLTSHLDRTNAIRIESTEYLWNGRGLIEATCEQIQDAILNWSCDITRQFARLGFYDKNRTDISSGWQKRIDAAVLASRKPVLEHAY